MSIQHVKCKSCKKTTPKYTNYQYNRPHIFCGNKCRINYFKLNPLVGSRVGTWKGDKAGYTSKHEWVYKHFGKATWCWNPGCNNINYDFEWANVNHKYKRDITDWIMLCQSCHSKFDKSYINRKRRKNGTFL